mmetsp:Transcript_26764/g.43716  ORF Transcript_26764/g.43716 Transcript_26764/m.43716 type:complete len:310 (-) Transcript_26764:319-1248(-)
MEKRAFLATLGALKPFQRSPGLKIFSGCCGFQIGNKTFVCFEPEADDEDTTQLDFEIQLSKHSEQQVLVVTFDRRHTFALSHERIVRVVLNTKLRQDAGENEQPPYAYFVLENASLRDKPLPVVTLRFWMETLSREDAAAQLNSAIEEIRKAFSSDPNVNPVSLPSHSSNEIAQGSGDIPEAEHDFNAWLLKKARLMQTLVDATHNVCQSMSRRDLTTMPKLTSVTMPFVDCLDSSIQLEVAAGHIRTKQKRVRDGLVSFTADGSSRGSRSQKMKARVASNDLQELQTFIKRKKILQEQEVIANLCAIK